MHTIKQQALFFFVALLSMFIFFLYQENITNFFKLPHAYMMTRLYKYGFAVLVNYALISLIYLMLRKTWVTLFFSQFLFFALNFINIKKEQYLSASLVPSDFLLVKETLIAAPWFLKTAALVGLALFLVFAIFIYRKEAKEPNSLIVSNALITITFFGFFVAANFSNNFQKYCSGASKSGTCTLTQALPNTRGDWIGDSLIIRNSGITTFFVSKSLDSINQKVFQTQVIPEDQIQKILLPKSSESVAKADVSKQSQKSTEPDTSQLPNIVFVMSEAHWDASKLDKSIPKNITPTIDKYKVGHMLSPTFGGGTANVEFEVLTGLNVFLNHDELAYVAKLKRPTYSLASYMNDLGYDTTAMHNNGKFFYNRNTVYQNFGFNRFTSIENMVSASERKKFTNTAGWATDDLLYQNIVAQLQKSKDQAQFIYAITVENHFNYNDDRFGKNNFNITKDGLSDLNKRRLNTYLSGLQRADQHFKKLIEDAKHIERPTMIIFFGDHLPNLGDVFDDYHFYANAEQKSTKNDVKFYQTPLAVWSNFDIDRKQFKTKDTTAHFLAVDTLKAAKLPLSPYYQFMSDLSQCYKKIHKTGIETNPKCDSKSNSILESYKQLNIDILNGKNFSYELLKVKPMA
ncbi:sulfatase-like hydrolase/transferase [Acinetobacter sp. 194]|nr:sulfatase-like hydrolase/transferase [Acinetobacter shaoyimingii]